MTESQIKVNSETSLYGVLGHPVQHSLSPLIHNSLFQKWSINAAYLAFDVTPESLGLAFEAIRALKIRGVNLTVPLKEVAINFIDEIPEAADRCVGALNTVVNRDGKLYGYNTDGPGFLTALKEDLSFNPEGKKALVLGAGGAARGVVFALARSGTEKIFIYNRTGVRADGLVEYLKKYYPKLDVESMRSPEEIAQENLDLVVNATSCGMKKSDPSPLDLRILKKKPVVYDLIYSAQTLLLKQARDLGLPCSDGLGMLAAQAALSFELWTGKKDGVREGMLEILRKCQF